MKKIIVILFILFLTGCYNYKELNSLDIVSSIGIDYEDNMYDVSVQVLNGKQSKDSEDSQIIVYDSKGKTINEALRNMYSKTSKELYRGHITNLVLSQDVAKKGIINIIDVFERYTDIRDEMNIMVVKNESAKNTLKVLTSEELVPAEYLNLAIDNKTKKTGATSSTKLDEFSSNYLKKYIDPVITTVSVKNYKNKGDTIDNITTSDPITKLYVNNIGITHNGKLVDYLNKKETIGYNFITNKIDNIVVPIKCNKNSYASISIINSKTNKKIYKKDNKYIIELKVNSISNISEYNCSNNINNNDSISFIEKKTNKVIRNYMNLALKKQNNTNSEFLGLKRMIYLNNSNYNNEKFVIKTKVNVRINRKGENKNSIKEK